MIFCMVKPEDLLKLEEKIKRLKERKKKLEQKLKRDTLKALTYAKEVSFCYLEALIFKDGKAGFNFAKFIECISQSLCKRSKDKAKCFQDRLELMLQYKDLYPGVAYYLTFFKNSLPKLIDGFKLYQKMKEKEKAEKS